MPAIRTGRSYTGKPTIVDYAIQAVVYAFVYASAIGLLWGRKGELIDPEAPLVSAFMAAPAFTVFAWILSMWALDVVDKGFGIAKKLATVAILLLGARLVVQQLAAM